jgi:antitoxin component of RelBE/YafQ-DinJ toxin-antitoxin module
MQTAMVAEKSAMPILMMVGKRPRTEEKTVCNIPNETTLRTMREADEGINLHRFNNAEEMFAALGI